MNSRNAAVARNLRKTLSVMSFPPGVFVSLNNNLVSLKADDPVAKSALAGRHGFSFP
jgi:hypothetical protein